MKHILAALFVGIVTSLYFFPFETIWFPEINTKMALAALAPFVFLLNRAKHRNSDPNFPMIALSCFALSVSLIGLASVIYNNTHDYTYASYFISMWVWIGGAYVVVKTMDWIYGNTTFRLLANFLIAVCLFQCALAQIIHNNINVAEAVDSFMSSTGTMGKNESRLYGIGCALDVAGIKFSAVLIITAFLCAFPESKEHPTIERCIYLLSFIIIATFGSMIARTTTTGLLLSLFLWLIVFLFKPEMRKNVLSILKILTIFFIILFPIASYFYETDPIFKENLRFGFEGFFSLVEKGEWDVKSNKMLTSMIIWPDNFKTWLIGDGYFENPMKDFYYTGPDYVYYKGVDTGYCRFLFYFGIVGLLAFSSVFVAAAIICSKNQPQYAIVFWFILLLNFICWIKVSSDIFPAFALFLCLKPSSDNNFIKENIISAA